MFNKEAMINQWVVLQLIEDEKNVLFVQDFDLFTLSAKVDVGYLRNLGSTMHTIDMFEHAIGMSLARSEKTRRGNLTEHFLGEVYANFGRVRVLEENPEHGLDRIYRRDGVIIAAQHKSGPNWGNRDSRAKLNENAVNYLETHYPGQDSMIVICSENGNGEVIDSVYEGYPVKELYGSCANEFFTGQKYPLEVIEQEAIDQLNQQRTMPLIQSNALLVSRRAKDLFTELMRYGGVLYGINLVDQDGSPIWNNWRRVQAMKATPMDRKAA